MGEQQQLGRYELGAEIGRGSTGVVYKARDPIIDRVVAIKTIDFRRLGEQQADAQERFFQEAKSAGRLSHPNIVTIYDAGEAQGCAYIAMELLEGCSLREMLDEHPPVSVGRALEITAQVARGLAYAHEHGIVHRDVKPANVILVGSRRAKITDFGIARLNTASSTAERELAGSPKYMSPEQITGDAVDGRSDLFSLGSMLYEMLAGRPPFDGNNVAAIMQAVRETTPKSPSSINAKIPQDVDKLIARMLAKSPDDRYPSARALLRELSSLLKKYSLRPIGEVDKDEARARAKRIKEVRRRKANEGDVTVVMTDSPAKGAARRPQGLPTSVFYGVAAVAVGVLVFISFLSHQEVNAEKLIPVHAATAPAKAARMPVAIEAAVVPSAVEEIQPVAATAASNEAASMTVATAVPITEKAGKPATARPSRKNAASAAQISPAVAAPVESATVMVAVSPWGEVIIDGESRGTTPPLSNIAITPGRHRIEIRNGNLTPYTAEINVGAGETRRIKHKFE